MIELLTRKTLNYLIEKEAIDGNNNDVFAFYKYGVEITISSIFNIIIILVISLLCNSLCEGLLFLLVFIPTRQFTGGYHADSYLKCNTVFGIGYLMTLVICYYTRSYLNIWLDLILLIIEDLLILIVCPIKNEHKPIKSQKQYIMCKLTSMFLFILFGIVGIFIKKYFSMYGGMILYTLHLIVVMGIMGIIKERRKANEKAEQIG